MSDRLNPIIVDAPQRSDIWFKARLGIVTGSKATATMSYYAVSDAQIVKAADYYAMNGLVDDPILARLRVDYPFEYCLRAEVKLREKADRQSYRQNIVGERLTGMPSDPDQYLTYAMKWGMINESLALALYQLKIGSIIAPAPLLLHPEWKCGASPDSLVIDPTTGLLGNVECKCLMTANHLYKIILEGKVPSEYIPQIQMQMWINGRDFCDFVGFDGRLPDGLQIYIERVERDDFYIDEVLAPSVKRFLDECDRDFKRFWAMMTDKGKVVAGLISKEFLHE